MSGAYQQYAGGQTAAVAGYGYKQLPAAGPSGTAVITALLCAGIGVLLGILLGSAFAASVWFRNSPEAPPSSPQARLSTATVDSRPVADAGQAQALDRQADNLTAGKLSSPPKSTAAIASATPKLSAVQVQPAFRPASAARPSSPRRKPSSMRPSGVFPRVPAPAALPLGNEAARLDDAPGPFLFTIEGDVTVADYDALNGTIETQQGKTFVIDRTASESDTAPWQDFRANLHYRCDQAGNCTLFRAGVIVPNARMGS